MLGQMEMSMQTFVTVAFIITGGASDKCSTKGKENRFPERITVHTPS